jgi:hypothetical protein
MSLRGVGFLLPSLLTRAMLRDVEGKLWVAALRKLLLALSFTCVP